MCSDESLMTAVSHGDTNAFEQILNRYQVPVWRMAVRFVKNEADAQDIAQSVFLKLFESAKRYNIKALFKTFLFQIVTSTCIDFLRKKRPVLLDEPPDIQDDSPSASEAMIAGEKNKILRNAIDSLPLRQRSAIILRYDAELPIRDIAEIIKTSEKATERLLAHARAALHLRLEKLLE